jgi:3-dehydroquinate synthase
MTIDVMASTPYQVEIGQAILPTLGSRLRALCPKAQRAVLVTDDSVFPLHGKPALDSLAQAGLETTHYILPHGESSKTAQNLIELLNFLTGQHLTRSDCLVALGGGVIGDLTGFAAAVYMRGIAYIQVPTTVLSMVDSSVGGKTAVDLPAGKNLMGAFWQPKQVLCDVSLLDTLPPDIFTDGCAEIIKTAVLFDPTLFRLLEQDGRAFDREFVIGTCVGHKRDIVNEDEFDTGRRSLLNLGHTLAHAAEACSDFSLSHGRAVAIGMATVCRAAARAGLCPAELPGQVTALLKKFDLPIETDIPIQRLMIPMLSDKKRSGSKVSVVVPRQLGQCELCPMDEPTLQTFMASGLHAVS